MTDSAGVGSSRREGIGLVLPQSRVDWFMICRMVIQPTIEPAIWCLELFWGDAGSGFDHVGATGRRGAEALTRAVQSPVAKLVRIPFQDISTSIPDCTRNAQMYLNSSHRRSTIWS